MSDLRFDGRVAIVTGAGRGMGRAHALLLASRGAKVIINDNGSVPDGSGVELSPADAVVREIIEAGGEAAASTSSVATEDGAKEIVETALAAFGRVDILINNAGVVDFTPFKEMDYAHFRRIAQVHYDGAWLVTRAAWPHMLTQGYGRIVFVTSQAGLAGMANLTHYGSAKWAAAGLARMLSFETEGADIRVNALGVLAYTRLMKDFFNPSAVERPDLQVQSHGEDWWSRNVTPDQIAPVAAWLAHENCSLNGDILDTSAGHVYRYILSTTEGFSKTDLSLEDVQQNIAGILNDEKTYVWADAGEALQWRMRRALDGGAESMGS